MKKRILHILLVLMLCMLQVMPAAAQEAEQTERLRDMADCLTENDAAKLQKTLDEISIRQKCDVVIFTVDSLNGKTPQDAADDYFDNCGYGIGEAKDGILLLISMNERKWHISTHGYGITAFTDTGLAYIASRFQSDLSEGNYAAAFQTFAEESDAFLTQAKTDKPYDTGNLPHKPLSSVWIAISIAAGIILALIVIIIMLNKLKSVRRQPAANSYIHRDSLKITHSTDLFLYNTMTRTKKPEPESSGSSTHSSSSGRTHGGRGGSF